MPHPAESELLGTSSRRRGSIGAKTPEEASVHHDAMQPHHGAASNQDEKGHEAKPFLPSYWRPLQHNK